MGGLHPVVFWTGWGIHVSVLVSFAAQVTLLLLSDIRRRKDWVLLKVVIWSAYTLADIVAIYALGHMSALCNWLPEHQLMALWAPLLLVHLGGQDNITAYAIEDNRLWLRHLQNCLVQVALALNVLHASSILSHPSKLRSAAILMFLVGIFKYGERIRALMRADSCCSSSLSATSYDKARSVGTAADDYKLAKIAWMKESKYRHLILAHSLLDVPKQMFEGPTTYVQISSINVDYDADDMVHVVEKQVSMMYDLLYTKAAVVHTWYGLCSRVFFSLPFTVAALALFRGQDVAAAYRGVDVTVTKILLTGAVVLETMSVLRAIFSKWTAVLLFDIGLDTIGNKVYGVELFVTEAMQLIYAIICRSEVDYLFLGRMRQHSLFNMVPHSIIRKKMAKRMGVDDWWDSNVSSWSTEVPTPVIKKVRKLVSSRACSQPSQPAVLSLTASASQQPASSTFSHSISQPASQPNALLELAVWTPESQGQNAVCKHMKNKQLAIWIWTGEDLKLEDRILVWHIATHLYLWWSDHTNGYMWGQLVKETLAVANYMFFLLAARPYMLPYPVSRRAYAHLCSDAVTHFTRYSQESDLVKAILEQKQALIDGTPLQRQPINNSILDRGCQLAAKLIHITATPPPKEMKNESTTVQKTSRKKQKQQREEIVDGSEGGQTETFSFSHNNRQVVVLNKIQYKDVLDMVSDVWVEMLCHTANLCNENYHAKHLSDGGEIMTTITLLMIYAKNRFIRQDTIAARFPGREVWAAAMERTLASLGMDSMLDTMF